MYKIRLSAILSGIFLLLTTSTTFAQTSETRTASGTWTCPTGITTIFVECWAGGGGGGGTSGGGATNSGSGGGGGGAAGCYTSANVPVVPGTIYTVTVGLGGTGITAVNGNMGGDTWFNTNTTILAKGGAGGNTSTPAIRSGAGATGSSAGCIGTTIFAGGNGGSGNGVNASANGYSGGGGGSAGRLSAGGNANARIGGTAGNDGGVAGPNGNSVGLPVNGTAGSAPGAGGAGGLQTVNSGQNKAGGAGGRGQMIITYTIPLPIVLEYFKGTTTDKTNHLQWKINNDEPGLITATLERSENGNDFYPLYDHNVDRTSSGKVYMYDDRSLKAGTYHYRLRITEESGQRIYSKTETLVSANNTLATIKLYPNPVRQRSTLLVAATENGKATITIFDIAGRMIARKHIDMQQGENKIELDFSHLNAGAYQVSLFHNSTMPQTFSFIKQ